MATVDDALSWAARGFRVFPLVPGDKVPPKGMPFKVEATTDPAKIRAWWRAVPDYNYAVLCGGGWLLLDVDSHKGGMASLLDLPFDLPSTLTVRTPGGGLHFYLRGPDVRSSVDRLGTGLDVRSAGGYVVGPGSFFADPGGRKGYTGRYTVETDAAPAEAPEALVLLCGTPRERAGNAPISVDAETDIEHARHWLAKSAPVAIEGRGGNDTTYRVAAELLERGVSTDTALVLLLDEWNPRCLPPWERDDLRAVIEHAAVYMTGTVGARGVTADAAGYGDVTVLTQAEQARGKFAPVFAARRWLDAADIKPDDWLMHRMLLRRKTALLTGPGAAGKSSMTLAIAAHAACGAPFVGHHVDRPCRVVVANSEDNLGTMTGRLLAICAAYELDMEAVKRNLVLWPGDYGAGEDEPPRFRLFTTDHKLAEGDISELARELRQGAFDALVLDPLAKLHAENENDNVAMGAVLDAADRLARAADIALLLVHHAGKGERAAGSSDAARGASVITTSSRIVKTLYPADEADEKVYGLGEGARARFCRLDDAKINDAALATVPQWFERQTFPLSATVTAYALRPRGTPKVLAENERAEIARALGDFLLRSNTLRVTTYHAAKALVAEQPHFRDRFPDDGSLQKLRQVIENRLSTAVMLEGGHVVRVLADTQDGRVQSFVEIS